jgi:hypothetical protein
MLLTNVSIHLLTGPWPGDGNGGNITSTNPVAPTRNLHNIKDNTNMAIGPLSRRDTHMTPLLNRCHWEETQNKKCVRKQFALCNVTESIMSLQC